MDSRRTKRSPVARKETTMEAQPSLARLLTVQEAAEAAHVCTKTIYRAINAGDLQATRIARVAIRIHPSWLMEWIENGRTLGDRYITAVPGPTYPEVRPKGQPRRGYLEK